jgi:hypothetical protein
VKSPLFNQHEINEMKIKVLVLLVLGCALVAACATRRVQDYTFDVTGTVSAEDGTALQGVEVILQVDNPIYEGVAPVKTQRLVTSKGAFLFRCLSHSPTTKYSVAVRKDGFERKPFRAALLLIRTS